MTRTDLLMAEILGTLTGIEALIPFAHGEALENLCLLYTSTYILKLRTMP